MPRPNRTAIYKTPCPDCGGPQGGTVGVRLQDGAYQAFAVLLCAQGHRHELSEVPVHRG